MKTLTVGEAAKVEASPPAVFIQVCCKIVVVSCKGRILRFPGLKALATDRAH